MYAIICLIAQTVSGLTSPKNTTNTKSLDQCARWEICLFYVIRVQKNRRIAQPAFLQLQLRKRSNSHQLLMRESIASRISVTKSSWPNLTAQKVDRH